VQQPSDAEAIYLTVCSTCAGSTHAVGFFSETLFGLVSIIKLRDGLANCHLRQVKEGKGISPPMGLKSLVSMRRSLRSTEISIFFLRYGFCSLLRLQRMLFSTVFLFALYVSRPGSVPAGVQ
jgi:hypothetical protein